MVESKVLISSHAFIYLSALAYFENFLILIYMDTFFPILACMLIFPSVFWLLLTRLLLNKISRLL